MFLLDTHIWFWWVNQDFNKIPKHYLNILEKEKIFVSSVSLIEISMLAQKGRIVLQQSFNEWIEYATNKSDLKTIELEVDVLKRFYSLKAMHKDFMDRLIIATAIEKNLQLLSLDGEFPKYKDFGLQLY